MRPPPCYPRHAGRGLRCLQAEGRFRAHGRPQETCALRDDPATGIALMAAADQAWDEAAAVRFLAATDEIGLDWREEPVIASTPGAVWHRLGAGTATPIAGGENLGDMDVSTLAVDGRHLRVVQPGVDKWGGIAGVPTSCRAGPRSRAALLPAFCWAAASGTRLHRHAPRQPFRGRGRLRAPRRRGIIRDRPDRVAKAVERIDEMAGADGIDALLFGPGDLSASMGCLGRPGDADVTPTIGAGGSRLAPPRPETGRRRPGPPGPRRSAPSCSPAPPAPASVAFGIASRPARCLAALRDGRCA